MRKEKVAAMQKNKQKAKRHKRLNLVLGRNIDGVNDKRNKENEDDAGG